MNSENSQKLYQTFTHEKHNVKMTNPSQQGLKHSNDV